MREQPTCAIRECNSALAMAITFTPYDSPVGTHTVYACRPHLSRALRMVADVNDRTEELVRALVEKLGPWDDDG